MQDHPSNIVTTCLRGASQVFFMQNAWTGLLFLLAMGYASYLTGVWATTVGAVVGLVVATLTAKLALDDQDSVASGLYGFNGILVGAALPTFIEPVATLWFYVVVGAAASTIFTAAFSATLTRSWGIPGSTGPFVLTGWLLAAGAYSFGSLELTGVSPHLVSDYLQGKAHIPAPVELIQIFFRNIAQVFLLGSAVSGVIILAGIFLASVTAGVAASLGSLLAMLVAILLRADPVAVSQGLYGFSAVLTAMAIGVVFLKPSLRVFLYAGLATVVTVFVQGGLDAMMLPDGLPSFTAPYVLTMYLFMAPRKLLAPHPHASTASDHLLHP